MFRVYTFRFVNDSYYVNSVKQSSNKNLRPATL